MGDQLEEGATYNFEKEKEVDPVTAERQASAHCLERSWSTSCWVVPSHLQIHKGQENNIGWVVEADNIVAIAEMLDKAVVDIGIKEFSSPRKVLVDKYSSELAMNKILDIIRSL